MEKQPKKSKKLLWILLAAVVTIVAAAAVLLMIFREKPQEAYQSKIYWNVERARYVAQGHYGVSGRIPQSDGYYHITMAVDGEQTEVLVADINLVNRIDFEEVMGLSFDENGIVDGILYLDEFTGGIVADKYAVVSVEGNKVVCNVSAKYKGLEVTYELSEDTRIWQVSDFEPMIGLPTVISEGDQVLMIQDMEGNITDVYVFPFVPPGDVYWNITRMYDSATASTTRERDELGYYVYDFAINGQIETLKTKDKDVADLIDKHASQAMGFNFDENGLIIEVINAGNKVCGGGLLCNRYSVTELTKDSMTVRSGTKSYTASISKDCKFFDVSGNSDRIGQPVDGLLLGDKVTVLKDRRDQVCVVFITNRMTEDDIYWVVERKEVWNRTTWSTDRKPAADGWYYIKLAGNGKQITAKSKDAELVNQLDSYVCWCVEFDGDEIVRIQDAKNRYGGNLFGAFNELISIEGNQLTVQKTSSTATATMAEDCVVYNVSTSAITVGDPTTVRVGDTIYGFTDMEGVVRYIFVTATTYDGDIYWNTTRMYDDTKKETTRQRGADGYYHFEMVVNGKVVWLKTADKEIANQIDLVKTRARGLKVSGDVIVGVLAPNALTNYQNVKPDLNNVRVQTVNGRNITAINGKKENLKITLAPNCKVYNVTNGYVDHKGELTTLRPDDLIVTLVNENKQAVIVYVCGGRTRQFTTQKNDCGCANKGTWKPWDGKSQLTGGNYYLTRDVVAPEGGYVISGITVNLRLDGHTITASKGKALVVQEGANVRICDHKTRGAIIGAGDGGDSGGVVQNRNSNASLDIYNIDIYATGGSMDNGAVIANSGWMSLYNVNVYGGVANKKGGNIAVMPTGTFRMFGGSISGGKAAADGDNLYIVGNTYLEDVTVQGGITANAADKTVIIHGGKISGANGVKLSAGKLTLSGKVDISANESFNIYMSAGTVLDVAKLSKDAKVGITAAAEGIIGENATKDAYSAIFCDSSDYQLKLDGSKLQMLFAHRHCMAEGQEIGYVKLTQSMFDNATENSAPVFIKGSNYVLAGGSYYLGENITTTQQILVYDKVNLCLNGCSLTATTSRAFALTGATLNVTDCGSTGSIVGGTAGNAANILLQGSKGGANGDPSTLNVYAGTLVGGTTTAANGAHGGNVQVYCGTLNVYGGTLTGGTAKAWGGTVYLNAGQSMNIYGGQILAGTAGLGDCVAVTEGSHVTLNGLVQVDQLYLNDLITVTKLEEGSKVGVYCAKPGVIAQNVEQDVASMFTCGEDNTVVYSTDDKTLSYTFAHMHCICNEFDGHECTQQSWIGLTQADILAGKYTLNADNYYYLKEDVQLTAHLIVGSKKTLNICLNGHTITAPAAARVFVIAGGTLNLTDCKDSGTLVATKATTGGAILVQGSGGGATGDYMGTLNMYGGTVCGGEVTMGGAVAVTGGTMNMYGGALTGGTAKTNGGTLYVEKGQNLHLYGGQITTGTAAVGACLYADVETTITLNGIGVLEAVHLNGTQLVVESVADDFTTQISAAASGVLIQNVEEAVAKKFTTAPENTLTYDPDAKTLSITLPVQYEHSHCICDAMEGHGCTVVEWIGLSEADLLAGNYTADASHYYYLTENVDLTAAITVANGTQLNLCLNGKTVTAPSGIRALVVNGGVVNITDCQDTGALIGAGTKNGGTVYIQAIKGNPGQVNLYGGTIQGNNCSNGGAVYIDGGSMNMYGGAVNGANVSNAAGAVFVKANQSMNIFGGTITAGTAATKADCVLVVGGATVTVGGNAQVAEIYLNSNVKLQLSAEYPLKNTARIGVRMDKIGVFIDDIQDYIEGTFICKNAGKVLYWDPETKKLSIAEPAANADDTE